MKQKVLITLVFVFVYSFASAQTVTKQEAQSVAENFLLERINNNRDLAQKFIIKFDTLISENNTPLFYLFKMRHNGWIMVSGNKSVVPVIAYSYNGYYDHYDQPPAFLSMLKDFSKQILFPNKLPESKKVANIKKWNYYQLKTNCQKKEVEKAGPLVDVAWRQGCYYNDSTPLDPDGPCGHCVTGCGSTAIAQILHYHRYPVQGVGSNCYEHMNYGTLCANFGTTIYNWSEMDIVELDDYNPAVAQLMYHCGVAAEVFYGPNATYGSCYNNIEDFVYYFNYDPDCEFVNREGYSNQSWDDMIKDEIDCERPVHYSGSNGQSYHAFVIDGYENEYYHINLGWGFNNLRYVLLDSMQFNQGQIALIGFQPEIHFKSNQSGHTPDTVEFTNLSTVNANSWLWEFGDGTNSTEESPTHIYTDPGTYSVTLTAYTDKETFSRTRENYLNIKLIDFEKIEQSFACLYLPVSDWGDYDNDGDLDLILSGYLQDTIFKTYIYRNEGNDNFTEIDADIPGTWGGAVEWGDFDNDGDLDFILTGGTQWYKKDWYAPITKLYINKGNDNFTANTFDLKQLALSDVKWADFNNDGYSDIIIAGTDCTDEITKIYKNFKGIYFTEVNCDFIPLAEANIAVADYDNDGDIDICYTGNAGFIAALLYENQGNFDFELHDGFESMYMGALDWGDYDNDGDPDLLISGQKGDYPNEIYYSKIYNNDDGNFSDINAQIVSLAWSSGSWGDYDNDGKLDFIISGKRKYYGPKVSSCFLYHNEGDNQFTCYNNELVGYDLGNTEFVDYNNDGHLDIFTNGTYRYDSYNYEAIDLYKNQSTKTNEKPNSPLNLYSELLEYNKVKLSWDKGDDDITPGTGLNYNLFVGTSTDKQDVVSSLSEIENGLRLKTQLGNMFQDTAYILGDLKEGETYYWSIQSIDGAYQGSEFANVNSFTTGYVGLKNNKISDNDVTIYPNPCNDVLYIIKAEECSSIIFISIYDALGSCLYHNLNKSTSAFDSIEKINCRHFKDGVYYVKVGFKDFIVTKKFIVNHGF